jgi:hypothetical protein
LDTAESFIADAKSGSYRLADAVRAECSHLALQQFIADDLSPQHFPSAQPPFFWHCFMHFFMSLPAQHLASAISLPAQHDFPSFASHLASWGLAAPFVFALA